MLKIDRVDITKIVIILNLYMIFLIHNLIHEFLFGVIIYMEFVLSFIYIYIYN